MNLSRQLVTYIVVGALQWLLDCSLMMALSHSLLPVVQANIAGRVAGAALGFWLNGRYTFASATPLTGRPLIRFLTMWLALTVLGSLLLGWTRESHSLQAAWLLKPLLEAGFAVIGFVLSRYWVYR
ncbi:MAG: GtrA family protein [Pseudomonadota bacterium]|nr:GtrA family protein [Pseudomonadota bacterium]